MIGDEQKKSHQTWLAGTQWTVESTFGGENWFFFPQTGLPVGFYLRKKGTGQAGGRAVLCWGRVWLCWAHWAGLGMDLALLVGWAWDLAAGLGWRGVWVSWARWAGCAGRAGLGWARIWLSVYGLHCTCLLHVFMMVFWFGWFTCAVWGLCWYHLLHLQLQM